MRGTTVGTKEKGFIHYHVCFIVAVFSLLSCIVRWKIEFQICFYIYSESSTKVITKTTAKEHVIGLGVSRAIVIIVTDSDWTDLFLCLQLYSFQCLQFVWPAITANIFAEKQMWVLASDQEAFDVLFMFLAVHGLIKHAVAITNRQDL